MKNFGIGQFILGAFAFLTVIGLLVFSGAIKVGSSKTEAKGTVKIWGTLPFSVMQKYTEELKTKNIKVVYEVQDPALYENDLINAFAAGSGPDLFIMPHEDILRHSDKLLEIPFANYPRQSFESNYVDGAKILLGPSGVKAFPLVVDPLIMYYNKRLISSAFLLDTPEYWDELSKFSLELNSISDNDEISTSSIALGTYNNVNHAKGIISALMLQNQNEVVGVNSFTGKYASYISADERSAQQAAQVFDFYTSFADRGNQNYSWNESLRNSLETFIAGDLALYIGPASELESIRKKNPNLDFDVTLLPQVRDTKDRKTYGSYLGVAVSKQTKSKAASINIAAKLAGNPISGKLARDLLVAPPRRDLLSTKPDQSHLNLIFNSAIISAAWIDPDPVNTSRMFESIIDNVNSGALDTVDAVNRASSDLNIILNRTINKTIPDRSVEQS